MTDPRLTSPEEVIRPLALKWRNTIRLAFMVRLLAVIAVAIILLLAAPRLPDWLVFSLAAVLLLVICLKWLRQLGIKENDSRAIARYLNRILPELEESAELLIAGESSLSPLQKMQRERVANALKAIDSRRVLPQTPVQSAARFFAIAVLAASLSAFALSFFRNSQEGVGRLLSSLPQPGAQSFLSTSPGIERLVLLIQPPAYTGVPNRTSENPKMRVEEGARVTWHLYPDRSLANTVLIINDNDTLQMEFGGDDRYQASQTIRQSGYYYFDLDGKDSATVQTEYFPIEVIRDQPPALTMEQPEERTAFGLADQKIVTFQGTAVDDYAITNARLVATLASGSGESVRFREFSLALEGLVRPDQKHLKLFHEQDLTRLGAQPGDELYFYLVVSDNREPVPQHTRSDIFIVALEDTAASMTVAAEGLIINPIPEYFRSQRQIIIDTEKLIAEQRSLPTSRFKERSQSLAIDQKALRLRYGQFLGEESESGLIAEVEESGEKPHDEEHHLESSEEEHQHEAEESLQTGEQFQAPEQAIVEQFGHSHDFAENATLFSDSVKFQLKAALAQMWDAELHLRTYEPAKALPFEYRALELIKDVQQRSRLYVKRIGFEPPPLRPQEKRLTGDLSDIDDLRMSSQQQAAEPAATIRTAIEILEDLSRRDRHAFAHEIAALETAERELTHKAASHPESYLAALRAFRTLIEELQQRNGSCTDCWPVAKRALWTLLPEMSGALRTTATPASRLGERYLMKLGGGDEID